MGSAPGCTRHWGWDIGAAEVTRQVDRRELLPQGLETADDGGVRKHPHCVLADIRHAERALRRVDGAAEQRGEYRRVLRGGYRAAPSLSELAERLAVMQREHNARGGPQMELQLMHLLLHKLLQLLQPQLGYSLKLPGMANPLVLGLPVELLQD